MATSRRSDLAIHHWLKTVKGRDQAECCISYRNNQWEIDSWLVPGITQPTDAEVETMIDTYEAYVAQEETNKNNRISSIKTKLGNLSSDDVTALKELLDIKK